MTENPLVLLRTAKGDITLRIFADKAPLSAASFLRYVDGGKFDGESIFRIVTLTNDLPTQAANIQCIHGGWREHFEGEAMPYEKIALEHTQITGLKHKRGTLSLGRYEEGNSGWQFFVMMTDDPEMDFGGKRQPDGKGFAAFGEVETGMDVVEAIYDLANPSTTWLTPEEEIEILEAKRL